MQMSIWGLCSACFIAALPVIAPLTGAEVVYADLNYAFGTVAAIVVGYGGYETFKPSLTKTNPHA